jgi:hypothetical protein
MWCYVDLVTKRRLRYNGESLLALALIRYPPRPHATMFPVPLSTSTLNGNLA